MKKTLLIGLIIILIFFQAADVFACSLYYFGGDLTDDGGNLFIRAEDGDMNDENKLYLVTPAGLHKAGEDYRGCSDFVWTFTHDTYRYLSRRDDNLAGYCYDTGGTLDHQLYEGAGTNEYGLSITATQSLDANAIIQEVDSYSEDGLSEGEISTILLSESASAREAVMLLKYIVETYGTADEGFGVMLCDQNEQWYAEVVASHYFLAVLLPRDAAFFQANVSVLGLLDLDDTDHIIASDGLIELAQQAGTFIGDTEKNIIDYRRSFNDYLVEIPHGVPEENVPVWRGNCETRILTSLNYLEGTENRPEENILEDNPFIMSNIGQDGEIVPLHNDLKMTQTVTLDYLFAMFKIYPLGYSENVETHLYRFYPDEEMVLGTVEWNAMDNNQFTVFVPDYPVLMTDTWKGYRTPLPPAELVDEKPDTKDSYEMAGVYYAGYEIKDWSGLWHVLPEGFENSLSASFSALSNYLTYSDPGEEAISLTKECLSVMQQDFMHRFVDLTARLKEEKSLQLRQETATAASAQMAKEAHELVVSLYRHFVYGEDLPSNLPLMTR